MAAVLFIFRVVAFRQVRRSRVLAFSFVCYVDLSAGFCGLVIHRCMIPGFTSLEHPSFHVRPPDACARCAARAQRMTGTATLPDLPPQYVHDTTKPEDLLDLLEATPVEVLSVCPIAQETA